MIIVVWIYYKRDNMNENFFFDKFDKNRNSLINIGGKN